MSETAIQDNDAIQSPCYRPKLNISKDAKGDCKSPTSNGKGNERCK